MSRFLQEVDMSDQDEADNNEQQQQNQEQSQVEQQKQGLTAIELKKLKEQEKKNKKKDKKKKKKQEQKEQAQQDDILVQEKQPEQQITENQGQQEESKEQQDQSEQPQALSKNQKKKNKKKAKAADKKDEPPKDQPKKGKQGKSILSKKLAQQQQAIKEQEEQLQREREEQERLEAERIAKIEEDMRKKKEEKKRKAEIKKKKKEEQIKAGQTKEQIRKQEELKGLGGAAITTSNLTEEQRKEMTQKMKEEEIQRKKDAKKRRAEKQAEEQKKQQEALELLKQKEEQKINEVETLDEGDLINNIINAANKEGEQMDKTEEEKIKEYTTMQLFNMETQYRCPIVAILGHVDTGKTTILDYIRKTNVQAGEAGGITQQIGATFFPISKIREETAKIQSFFPVDLDIPGLQIIDTPGHESFSNLRSRGSSLCDFAILVIDLMHGMEKQTLESIELLRSRNTPFVIALNKIDRLYAWNVHEYESSKISLEKQEISVQQEFKNRYQQSFTDVAKLGLNPELYWENDNFKKYVSFVPTSGVTGEGLPDLFGVILHYVGNFQQEKITHKLDQFKATVMEVKMIEGHGTTIDVILVDGQLKEGDKIVLLGFDGPIVTYVRALITPHPLKELRVKNAYIHHKFINGAMGIKVSAPGLEKAVAGSELFVVNSEEEEENAKKIVQEELKKIKKKFKVRSKGVCVAASTLGSLEALLVFLKDSDIPVSYIRVGHVTKEDTVKALKSIIDDNERNKYVEYACILAFDVKILPEAQSYADKNNIKIFTADIIYHLFDQYTNYLKEIKIKKKEQAAKNAVFPCVIKPIQFFNNKDPIVMGVEVVEGILKIGTPLCTFNGDQIRLGVVTSLQSNHKDIPEARKKHGAIGISLKGEPQVMAGRHFTLKDLCCSVITRNSLDLLKDYFRDEMTKTDWDLCRKLKPFFKIL